MRYPSRILVSVHCPHGDPNTRLWSGSPQDVHMRYVRQGTDAFAICCGYSAVPRAFPSDSGLVKACWQTEIDRGPIETDRLESADRDSGKGDSQGARGL